MAQFLLYPLAAIYDGITSFRNWLYDRGSKRSYVSFIPTICIGNIAVGGTGKTPHTELLIRMLQRQGLHVAVLSRGYKRKSHGFVLANENCTAKKIGDEPYQMFHKFTGVTVAVDSDRVRGVKKLEALKDRPDVILLDDAFQHRSIQPGLNLLLSDINHPLWKDWLMPMGRLRESSRNKRRADAVILTKCKEETIEPKALQKIKKKLSLEPEQSLFFSRIKYGRLSNGMELSDVNGYSILLVTGIANPLPLEEEIEKHTLFKHICFEDHHNFSKSDVQQIEDTFNSLPGTRKLIITTEKDYTRLSPMLRNSSLCYLPIEVEMLQDDYDRLRQLVFKYLNLEKEENKPIEEIPETVAPTKTIDATEPIDSYSNYNEL